MHSDAFKRIADGEIAIEDEAALVEELTAALPEARVIKRLSDVHTARVITFELLTEER